MAVLLVLSLILVRNLRVENPGKKQLLLEAGQWELSHGGLTGRTAQQFIDHLLGRGEGKQ